MGWTIFYTKKTKNTEWLKYVEISIDTKSHSHVLEVLATGSGDWRGHGTLSQLFCVDEDVSLPPAGSTTSHALDPSFHDPVTGSAEFCIQTEQCLNMVGPCLEKLTALSCQIAATATVISVHMYAGCTKLPSVHNHHSSVLLQYATCLSEAQFCITEI